MRPEVTAIVLASLPGLFAAVAADLVERERVRARAGVRRRERGWGGGGRRLRAPTLRALGALGGIVVGVSVAGLPGAVMGGIAAIIVPLVALVLVAAIVVLVVWAVRRARRRRPSSTAPPVRP